MTRIALVCAIAVVCVASVSTADTPRIMNYQGILADAAGVVVPDGPYSVTFRLYTSPSGGSPIWEETQSVTVTKGIFSVELGSYTTLGCAFDQRYYLGISVAAEPELSPRIDLTSAPYSFTARRVEGSSNVFPETGSVGIGTKTPNVPLHITSASGQVGIRFDGNDAAWSSIYVNAQQPTACPMFGYLRSGVLRGASYMNAGDDWFLIVGPTERMVVTDGGNVGIGNFAPEQRLVVDGGIRIANTTTDVGGAIRFTGSDFEGYDGSTWKSFTDTGSGTVPSGTSGQTLRHDGVGWAANDFLYNSGSAIGIGTTSPLSKLHLAGDGQELVIVESSLMWGAAGLMLKTCGGDYDVLQLSKYGPSASGNISGVPAANLSLLNVGVNAGPLMLRTGSSGNMHFVTDNVERFRIGGDGGMDYFGPSYERLLEVDNTPYGGILNIYDEVDNRVVCAAASQHGVSGELVIFRDPSTYGVVLQGNWGETSDAAVSIYGESQSAVLNMSQSGNSSVQLPTGSIYDHEILDEAGVANYADVGPVEITLMWTAIGMRSIVTPSSGYVLAIANGWVQAYHTMGTPGGAIFGVSPTMTSIPEACEVHIRILENEPTGYRSLPLGCHGLFEIPSAGTHTFFFMGLKMGLSESIELNSTQFTLLFIPTAYGDVNPVTLGADAGAAHIEAARRPITGEDVARERAEAEALNTTRLERELAEIRAELEKIKVEIGSK